MTMLDDTPHPTSDGAARRVLLVEDDPDDALLISASLHASNQTHTIDRATDLQEALRLLGSTTYDVILLDLALPDSTGIDTYDRTAAVTSATPIVVLSGNDDTGTHLAALRSGAQDYIPKSPIPGPDLLERVLTHAEERARLTASVADHEARLRELIERSPDGIIVIDRTGAARLVNPAARLLIGDPERLITEMSLLSDTTRPKGATFRPDGDHGRVVEARAVGMDWEDDRADLVTLRDVTELEMAAAAAAHDEQTLSHELRTPIASMLGYIELLREGDLGSLTDEQVAAVRVLERNGRRLLELVTDMLALSGIESRREEREVTVLPVARLLHAVRHVVEPMIDGAGLTLHVVCDDAAGAIRCHGEQIERAVLNLLTNAIKFTPEGGSVELGASRESDAVLISVRDTGIGIDPEEITSIFERFCRTREATDQAVPGSGLGLSLTKAIIESHGGTVEVSSAPGCGSTFTMRLPQRREEDHRGM